MQRCAPGPAPAPALWGQGQDFLSGDGAGAEQDVLVRLQLVSMSSLSAGSSGPRGLVCPVS